MYAVEMKRTVLVLVWHSDNGIGCISRITVCERTSEYWDEWMAVCGR